MTSAVDIYLVRHGEAAATWGQCADPGLSELGQSQAQSAAAVLCDLLDGEVELVSSPLARARETAEPLARLLDTAVAVDEAFREVPAPVPLPQRQTWLRQFMQQRWHEQPEALCDWRDRALAQLLARRRSTVVFTHFLVINAVVGRVQGRDEVLAFWPDNASITRLSHTGNALQLVQLGEQMKTVVN